MHAYSISLQCQSAISEASLPRHVCPPLCCCCCYRLVPVPWQTTTRIPSSLWLPSSLSSSFTSSRTTAHATLGSTHSPAFRLGLGGLHMANEFKLFRRMMKKKHALSPYDRCYQCSPMRHAMRHHPMQREAARWVGVVQEPRQQLSEQWLKSTWTSLLFLAMALVL